METEGEETALLLATEGEGVVETAVLVVVAATEGERVVEITLLVVAATEGEGVLVAEIPLVLVAAPVQWGLQKRNRASSIKIIVMFVRMLAPLYHQAPWRPVPPLDCNILLKDKLLVIIIIILLLLLTWQ